MNQAKYIGMDVHQATISVAVLDSAGKLILASVLETKVRGSRHFEILPQPSESSAVRNRAEEALGSIAC